MQPDFKDLPEDQQKRVRKLTLAAAVGVNLLGNMGLTGVNVALPDIERSLGLSAVALGWVNLSLMMAMAVATAPVTRLSDLLGRRRLIIFGLVLAILGSAWNALAWNAEALLFSRVVTGVGLAAAFTAMMAMVTSVHPPHERGRVLGYTISSVYIGLSLGPMLAGFLVGAIGWPALFWFSALAFVPPLVLILMVKMEQVTARGEKFDYNGALWWGLAVITLFTGLAHLDRSWYGWGLTFLGALLAAGFVRASLKSPHPLLELRLFSASRRFSFSSLAALISYMSSTGVAFLLSLYLRYNRGLSPQEAGLVLMVQPVCQALVTPYAGRLSDKIDPGILASVGMGLIAAAIGVYALTLTPDTAMPILIAAMAFFGLGFAVFSAPNSNAIMGSVPPQHAGQAAGTITATRLCGQISSLAITTLVFSVMIGPGKITPDKYPRFMEAAHLCFTIFAPICLLGVLASLARGRRRAGPGPRSEGAALPGQPPRPGRN